MIFIMRHQAVIGHSFDINFVFLFISGENNDDIAIKHGENSSNSTNSNDDNSIYRKLSMSSRNLARNISSMGFPLEQVARITEKLGKDDKKVKK